MFPHEEYLCKALDETNNSITLLLHDLAALYTNRMAAKGDDAVFKRAMRLEKLIDKVTAELGPLVDSSTKLKLEE